MPSPLNAAAYLFADLLTFEENSFSASFVKYNPVTLQSGGGLNGRAGDVLQYRRRLEESWEPAQWVADVMSQEQILSKHLKAFI